MFVLTERYMQSNLSKPSEDVTALAAFNTQKKYHPPHIYIWILILHRVKFDTLYFPVTYWLFLLLTLLKVLAFFLQVDISPKLIFDI